MTDRTPPTKNPEKPSDSDLKRETEERFRAEKTVSRTVTADDEDHERKARTDLEMRAEQEKRLKE